MSRDTDLFFRVAAALSDQTRVQALLALRTGELCVCELVELLGLAPSTVSKHLSLLKAAHLVESRKEGRWQYYRLPGNRASEVVQQATNWTFSNLGGSSLANRTGKCLERLHGRPCCPEQKKT